MRRILTIAAALAFVGTASTAFAQSHQGGYLGLNPGKSVATSAPRATSPGSGQGGYLGKNPGAGVGAAQAAAPRRGSGQGGYLGLNPAG
jgi:hypothetical protein